MRVATGLASRSRLASSFFDALLNDVTGEQFWPPLIEPSARQPKGFWSRLLAIRDVQRPDGHCTIGP